jgi:hypothetical protein
MTVPHAFAVAAYGRSPHLEDCLRSLRAQSVQSPIVISTSTPHEGLATLAQRHGVALRAHGENRGIGADWNAALRATFMRRDSPRPRWTATASIQIRLSPFAMPTKFFPMGPHATIRGISASSGCW